MDEKDFNTMKIRIGRKNEITSRFLKQNSHTKRWKLRTGTLKRFSPESEKKSVPDLQTETIREYACGEFAMGLAEPYVRFWQTLESEIKFRKHTRNGCILVKATGLKSRYSPTVAREVYLLFRGDPLTTIDTFALVMLEPAQLEVVCMRSQFSFCSGS